MGNMFFAIKDRKSITSGKLSVKSNEVSKRYSKIPKINSSVYKPPKSETQK